MKTYHVTNQQRNDIERTETEYLQDAETIARTLSASNEKRNAEIYFVEDNFKCIHSMFYDGRMFEEEIK